jgi:Rieske Fe-S protein
MSTAKDESVGLSRRGFLKSALMVTGLATSYGTLSYFIIRYLFPVRRKDGKRRVFVAFSGDITENRTYPFSTPNGESYIMRKVLEEGRERYVAFSSRCPHLGCKLFWEQKRSIYFCPCHDGVFDPTGKAISGPPAKENKNLKPCEIDVIGNAVYAMVEQT